MHFVSTSPLFRPFSICLLKLAMAVPTSRHPLKVLDVAGVVMNVPTHFHEPLQFINHGAYGRVYKSQDPTIVQPEMHPDEEAYHAGFDQQDVDPAPLYQLVAVKRIMTPFITSQIAKQTYRELKLLRFFSDDVIEGTQHRKCANIVQLLDMYTLPGVNCHTMDDLYVVMEYVPQNLHNLTRSTALEEGQICHITDQILHGLAYMNSAGVMHRDLKPSNIGMRILKASTKVKFITSFRDLSGPPCPHT